METYTFECPFQKPGNQFNGNYLQPITHHAALWTSPLVFADYIKATITLSGVHFRLKKHTS